MIFRKRDEAGKKDNDRLKELLSVDHYEEIAIDDRKFMIELFDFEKKDTSETREFRRVCIDVRLNTPWEVLTITDLKCKILCILRRELTFKEVVNLFHNAAYAKNKTDLSGIDERNWRKYVNDHWERTKIDEYDLFLLKSNFKKEHLDKYRDIYAGSIIQHEDTISILKKNGGYSVYTFGQDGEIREHFSEIPITYIKILFSKWIYQDLKRDTEPYDGYSKHEEAAFGDMNNYSGDSFYLFSPHGDLKKFLTSRAELLKQNKGIMWIRIISENQADLIRSDSMLQELCKKNNIRISVHDGPGTIHDIAQNERYHVLFYTNGFSADDAADIGVWSVIHIH